ncbi:TRAP transporter large permease subunit [Granulosicoccus sp.]|nr:TRAP transporter large permease subunit [Granulosicoccus sp.]MDB4223873.1 TRAP transporter large permease subunit [Granulosicoccus sp.]
MELIGFLGQFMDLNQWMVLAMFLVFIVFLFIGIPVAYALIGVSLIFAMFGEYVLDEHRKALSEVIEFKRIGISYKKMFVNAGRFFGGIIKNPVLVALPMFIFMGLMLDQSGVAQRMMRAMQVLFGALRGGLALTVMLIGIILAASTGVIGASVVLLGVMGLPAMLEQNYGKSIATGTIAASGTLGILIPPSIMLVIMSDQLSISLGDLFMGALFPGLILGSLYIIFIVVYGLINPNAMPSPANREPVSTKVIFEVAISVVPPLALILLVLGSIFFGLATPTEASGLGAFGATVLAVLSGRLSFKVFRDVSRQTLNTAGYIVGIFIAANFFAYILRRYGGDEIIENMVLGSFENPYMIVCFILFIIFLLGFLLDWIEITLIIMPLMLPVILSLDLAVNGFGVVGEPSVVWFAILVAVTLQTSFLTPPVGFALFYLKGVCPPGVTLGHIYKGVVPFVLLQLIGLAIVFYWPELTTWLPAKAYGN